MHIYPEESSDKWQWIGGLIRCPKGNVQNLHNHSLPPPSTIAQCIKEEISKPVQLNPTLKPSDIACGKGVRFLSSAVDSACSHLGQVCREVLKVKEAAGMTYTNWTPSEFEVLADKIDVDDKSLSGASEESRKCYKTYGRPYLVSAGTEHGINYIFTLTPLMIKVANSAEFMQCDITYDKTREYPYLLNAGIFNDTLMEWMVIGRLRIDKQNSNAYCLAFKRKMLK